MTANLKSKIQNPKSHDPYASLRIPSYRWLILGHGALTIAREGQIVVVGWQVYEHTHDPLSLGIVGLAEAIPLLTIALYAGHLADRIARRTLAVVATLGMLLSAIALLSFTLRPEILAGSRVWPVYVVIFLSGIARAFVRPAIIALMAEAVPRELYANAVAWRASFWHFSAVVGPAAGGLLYGFGSARAAYLAVAIAMTGSLVAFATVRSVPRVVPDQHVPLGESLMTGFRFIFREPVVLAAMTLDLFSVLFGGAVALLPIFADMLHVGPQGLGVLRAAPAIGSLLIGVAIAHRPPFARAGTALLTSVTIFGLSIIAFAVSRNFYLSVALLFLGGAADNVSVVIRGTMIQTITPEHLIGRVSSVNQIFIGASNEIGAFESGVAAKFLGVVPSVIFGGMMTLVIVALTAWWSPQLRRLREIQA